MGCSADGAHQSSRPPGKEVMVAGSGKLVDKRATTTLAACGVDLLGKQ